MAHVRRWGGKAGFLQLDLQRENAFAEEATAELDRDGFFLNDGPIPGPHSMLSIGSAAWWGFVLREWRLEREGFARACGD